MNCKMDIENKKVLHSKEIIRNKSLNKKMEQNDTQFGGFGGPNSKRQPGIASGDYIEFSQEFDKEKDREKLKSIVKNFRRKYENVSEESLEDMCRPYFRARRSLRDITPRTNISEDHDEFFRRIDPFEVLDAKDFPTDLPPTLNHPEEIKRWMEEVLPTNSKEVPVNDTICHQMAMEELNNDLKRNISRPYAYYYKQARIDQVCEVEGAKFFERLSKTTTGMPTTTKSMRKMRDQLKGMFGTLDTHSLSRSSLEMPSYLIRGFRERFPEHCNDDGKSVDEKDFIFGNVRKRRDVNDKLKEKLSKGNAMFQSRFKTILSRSENRTKDNNTINNHENKRHPMFDSGAREKMVQNSLYKRFQSFTVNYDDFSPGQVKNESTTLFSLGNSLEEVIQFNENEELTHLIGLKNFKAKNFLKTLNSSDNTVNGVANNNFRDENNTITNGTLKVTPQRILKYRGLNDDLDFSFTKGKIIPAYDRKRPIQRPTFKKILRTQVFKFNKNYTSENEEHTYDPFSPGEAFLLKEKLVNNSKSNYETLNIFDENINRDKKADDHELEFKDGLFGYKNNRDKDNLKIINVFNQKNKNPQGNRVGGFEQILKPGVKSDLDSELEYKDGLFGLKPPSDFFIEGNVSKGRVRTTDIIIKRFPRINSTWGSQLRTQVFRYQKGEEIKRYELDNSADKITMVKKVNKNSENELYGCTQTLVDLGNKTMPKRKRRSLILEKRPKKSNVKSRKARNTNWKKGKDDSHFTDSERLDEKVINKKPDFVKDWDSRDKVYYRGENPHFKILKDDGTGDVPRFIREQCKEPSEEEDIIEGDRAVLKNFKEIDDYGVQSMPSQLKPDGGKSDRDHKDSVLEKFIEDVNKSSNTKITLDSNSFDYQFDDPARRYKLRVERLEKIIGSRVRTPGPDYFTMPPTTTELEAFQTKEINQITTKYTQWLTADSADVLEGNKEDLENFLNFQADQEIDKPWTEFDVEGMEKFLGKTLPNRNSSILYKLYRP